MPIFDTLGYVEKLTEAGVPRQQAVAQAQALIEILSEGTVTPGVVTILKADLLARMDALRTEVIERIDALRIEFGDRIDAVRNELGGRIEALKTDLAIFKARTNAKFTILFALHAVQIGILVYIVSRLP